MKNIIIDSNIAFSAMVNSNGAIGDLIFNSDEDFKFYSCNYMRHEIKKHWNRLMKISKLTDMQLEEAYLQLLNKIQFINEELVPHKTWQKAETLVGDIDPDDSEFIAMTIHLKGYLWTGDKELYNGLKKKKFTRIVYTNELLDIRKK